MRAKRRRTIPPAEARAAILGLYPSPEPSPMPKRCCGRCGEAKVTIKEPGGLCLSCQVKANAEARALLGDNEGPF